MLLDEGLEHRAEALCHSENRPRSSQVILITMCQIRYIYGQVGNYKLSESVFFILRYPAFDVCGRLWNFFL